MVSEDLTIVKVKKMKGGYWGGFNAHFIYHTRLMKSTRISRFLYRLVVRLALRNLNKFKISTQNGEAIKSELKDLIEFEERNSNSHHLNKNN